jgi:hypothetical protein
MFAGLVLLATAATYASQGASEPVKSAPEYFVTSEGAAAHLWVREGTNLRVIGHGACKDCPLIKAADEHAEGDGHDHGKKK